MYSKLKLQTKKFIKWFANDADILEIQKLITSRK